VTKVLFVSHSLGNKKNGGYVYSKNLLDNLKKIHSNSDFTVVTFGDNDSNYDSLITYKRPSKFHEKLLNKLFFNNGGISFLSENEIKKLVKNNEFQYCIFDGAYFGKILKWVKNNSNSTIYCFCQNVELIFNFFRFKNESFFHLTNIVTSYYNELLTLKYSDKKIVLTNSDRYSIEKIYNIKIDKVIPVSLENKFNLNLYKNFSKIRQSNKNCILFIGSYFGPNYVGVNWFIKNVLPKINFKLVIVGRGWENYRSKYSSYKNVEIVGSVDDIYSYYYKYDKLICPIFNGSGINVKLLEAMMMGINIYSSSFSLSHISMINLTGINEFFNSEDLIKKLNSSNISNLSLDNKSQEYFNNNYSNRVITKQLKETFDE